MQYPLPVEPSAVAARMIRHLTEAPPSFVCAFDGDLNELPVPESVPLSRHTVVWATTAVQPAEARQAVRIWHEALASGIGEGSVRRDDGTQTRIAIFDVRSTHGVVVVVGTETADHDEISDDEPEHPGSERPSVCRITKDAWAQITDVDEATEPMLGWTPADLVGQRQSQFVHPEDQEAILPAWVALLEQPGSTQRLRVRHRRADDDYMWVELINHNRLTSADGDIACYVVDITAQVEAEQALADRERMLSALTEILQQLTRSLPSGVGQFDRSGRVLYSNQVLFELLGVEPCESIEDLVRHVEDGENGSPSLLADSLHAACRGDTTSLEYEVRVGPFDGRTTRRCQITVRALTDGAGGAVISVTDVTDTVERRAELELRATTDFMTECLNRAATMAALDSALEHATSTVGAAVVFVDLDDFKSINDTLGHIMGDEVLRLVAARLRTVIRPGDIVGRIGGDEFLVVCPRCASPEMADRIQQRLAASIRQPAMIDGHLMLPAASLGVAWSDGSDEANALVSEADAAMYGAKQARRDRHPLQPPARNLGRSVQ